MKLQLTVALGLAVLATPAFATKARLQALGEDTYGSFYINDNRNIWLNPAQISNHKDLVTYEFGNNDQIVDQASTPRAEGGVYKAMGNLVYGVHFGSASNTGNQLRVGAGLFNAVGTPGNLTGATGNSNEQNNVDVFVGGDAGMKWGANLGYAKSSDQSDKTYAESMRTRLGVIMGDTQGYANINLINNAKGLNNLTAVGGGNVGAKFEGNLGFQVGVIHAYEGNTFTVDYRQFDAEGKIQGATKEDQSVQQLIVGAGRVTRLNDKTNLFTKAQFVNAKAENDAGVAGNFGDAGCELTPYLCEEYETMRIPVVIGLEAEATSWLTLRASVSQAVWGSEEDKDDERSIQNNTVVNAGATLKFGELSLDGVVGNNNSAGTIGESTATGNGTLRTDNLMTRVGMNYRF